MNIQQSAYVLHRYPYRNNSYITEFFTQEQGIVSVVCRGIRNNPTQQSNTCYVPLWIEYSQRASTLATLIKCEAQANPIPLKGYQLYCGMYLNELLLKLLAKQDSYSALFDSYHHTLHALAKTQELEPPLRNFELTLLKELGYEIQFDFVANTQEKIMPQKHYYYLPNCGFLEAENELTENLFAGETIIAIAGRQFNSEKILKAAKYLLRTTIDTLLGTRTLNSRQLFNKKNVVNEL